MEKIEDYYFEKAPVPEAIAHMAVPMMLGMCINTLFSLIDAFFIGLLNNTAMQAAVALALPFTTVLMAVGSMYGTGGGTFISRLLGEKAHESAKVVSAVTFYLTLISGIVFMLIAVPLLQPVLQLLGTDSGTYQFTRDFIVVFIIGSPFVIANFALEQVVRDEGASVVSMKGMVVSVVVNLVLDPILIFGCHLDIVGAAVATVAANVCAVIYYAYYLEKKSPALSGFLRKFKPSVPVLQEIFTVGISAFILAAFLLVSALLLNNFSARYGDYVVAGFSISQRIVQVSEFIAMGLCMGVVPLTAYAYSSKNPGRLKSLLKATATYLAVIIVALSAVVFLFRTPILELFSRDPNVISMGVYILAATLISSVFAGFSELFIGTFQAFGKAKEATVMSVLRGTLFIPVIFFGNIYFGVDGIVWSLTVCEVVACVMGGALLYRLRGEVARNMSMPKPEAVPASAPQA